MTFAQLEMRFLGMVEKAGERHGGAQVPVPKMVITGRQNEYLYDPCEDITAYEAARMIDLVYTQIGISLGQIPPVVADAAMATLPPEMHRHFMVKPRPKIVVP